MKKPVRPRPNRRPIRKVVAAQEHAKKHGGAKDANVADDPKSPSPASGSTKPKSHVERGQIWVKDGLLAKPVKVQIGVTDGIDTEISGAGIEEGAEVIVGEVTAEQAAADMGNPFAPKMFKRAGGPGKGPS